MKQTVMQSRSHIAKKGKSVWKLYQSFQKCRLIHSSRLEVVQTIYSWETGEGPGIKGNDLGDEADNSWVGNKGPVGNSLAGRG